MYHIVFRVYKKKGSLWLAGEGVEMANSKHSTTLMCYIGVCSAYKTTTLVELLYFLMAMVPFPMSHEDHF